LWYLPILEGRWVYFPLKVILTIYQINIFVVEYIKEFWHTSIKKENKRSMILLSIVTFSSTHYHMTIIFPTLLLSRAPYFFSKNILFRFYNPNHIVDIFELCNLKHNKTKKICCDWYQRSLLTVVHLRKSCNAITGIVWTVNNDHDIIKHS